MTAPVPDRRDPSVPDQQPIRDGESTRGHDPTTADAEAPTVGCGFAEIPPTTRGQDTSPTVSPVVDTIDLIAVTDVTPTAYAFVSAVNKDHFIAQWIDYASRRTDAAHEYHEAAALTLLAGATPRVRAQLAPYPNGLPTNLYGLLIGDSTISRKSTSKDFSRDVQDRAIPGSISADQFSPEGFVEQLAERPHNTTTVYVDEFGELLEKLHHAKYMAGMRGLLMTVYGGDDYTYMRARVASSMPTPESLTDSRT